MAEIVGEFTCGNCGETVDLKRDSRNKFYYHCGCGQHFMRGAKGADVVYEKGVIYGAQAPEKPAEKEPEKPASGYQPPAPEERPPQQAEPEKTKPEKSRSTFF